MRIVYVCADRGIPLLGDKGASVHVRQVTAALQRAGHHVDVAVANLGHRAPPPDVERVLVLAAEPATRQRELNDLIADADLVIERYSLGCGPGRNASAAAGVRFILEVNAPLVAEAARYRGLQDVDRWAAWEAATWATADVIVAVSRPLQRLIATAAPSTPTVLLRNGVQLAALPDRGDARAALGIRPGQVVLTFTGSMKPWHGVLELMDAYATLPPELDTVLLLAGHGPLEPELRQRAATLGPNVRVLGAVPHHQIGTLLAASDIGVAPYLPVEDSYFCPLKVLEYLAAGLPVVFSDEGDIAEIVGGAGAGVPAADVGALAAALSAMATDPVTRARHAALAPNQVTTASWDHVAARLLSLVPVAAAHPVRS